MTTETMVTPIHRLAIKLQCEIAVAYENGRISGADRRSYHDRVNMVAARHALHLMDYATAEDNLFHAGRDLDKLLRRTA